MSPWPTGRKRNRHESSILKFFKEDEEDSDIMVCQVKIDASMSTDDPCSSSASSAVSAICGQKFRIGTEGTKDLGKY